MATVSVMRDAATQLEQAARWIAQLGSQDVPPDVRSLAINQRLNILASLFAGARTAAGQAIRRAIDTQDASGQVEISICSGFGSSGS